MKSVCRHSISASDWYTTVRALEAPIYSWKCLQTLTKVVCTSGLMSINFEAPVYSFSNHRKASQKFCVHSPGSTNPVRRDLDREGMSPARAGGVPSTAPGENRRRRALQVHHHRPVRLAAVRRARLEGRFVADGSQRGARRHVATSARARSTARSIVFERQ